MSVFLTLFNFIVFIIFQLVEENVDARHFILEKQQAYFLHCHRISSVLFSLCLEKALRASFTPRETRGLVSSSPSFLLVLYSLSRGKLDVGHLLLLCQEESRVMDYRLFPLGSSCFLPLHFVLRKFSV